MRRFQQFGELSQRTKQVCIERVAGCECATIPGRHGQQQNEPPARFRSEDGDQLCESFYGHVPSPFHSSHDAADKARAFRKFGLAQTRPPAVRP
jgi:hypothetical protein